MRLSSRSDRSRCRWHMHLTNHGYFDYWEKPTYPQFEPHAGISLVYLRVWHKYILFQTGGIVCTISRWQLCWSHLGMVTIVCMSHVSIPLFCAHTLHSAGLGLHSNFDIASSNMHVDVTASFKWYSLWNIKFWCIKISLAYMYFIIQKACKVCAVLCLVLYTINKQKEIKLTLLSFSFILLGRFWYSKTGRHA